MISESRLKRTLALIQKDPANAKYFFDNLASREWIEPLHSAGLFSTPPDPIHSEGYIQFPIWPASRYLARMAEHSPDIVGSIFLQIPNTDNFRIYEDMAQAALQMPMHIAASLVDRLLHSASNPYTHFLPERLASLTIELLKAGLRNEALQLCNALLSFEDQSSESNDASKADARPMLRDHYFKDTIAFYATHLAQLLGLEALDIMVQVTKQYYTHSHTTQQNDYTWINRPAVETHEQNAGSDILDSIVDAVRDVAMQLVDHHDLEEVTATLTRPKLSLLTRIALYVVSKHRDPSLQLVRYFLMNQKNFQSSVLHHEYYGLLESHFNLLSPEDQDSFFLWVDQDCEQRRMRKLLHKDEAFDSSQLAQMSRIAKLSRLKPVARHLKGDRLEEYQKLLGSGPKPQHPEFLTYSYAARWQSGSPLEDDEILSMSPALVIDYILSFQPSESRFDGPTDEGLARALRKRVEASPSEFAELAFRFVSARPVFIGYLFQALESSLRSGVDFHVDECLLLASDCLQSSERSVSSDSVHSELDYSWNWTRRSVADFIGAVCSVSRSVANLSHRERLWELASTLASDSDPTPEYEERYGGSNMKPCELALNTTRPVAIATVFRYIFWVRSCHCGASFSIEDVPEARRVLEDHLDLSIDPSLAVRSVYGRFASACMEFDQTWWESIGPRVFDEVDGREKYWHASWDTFLTFTVIQPGLFDILRSEYEYAIQRMRYRKEDFGLVSSDAQLGKHILWFFATGRLDGDGQRLLVDFIENADAPILRSALGDLGRRLRRDQPTLASDIRVRLQNLWTLYLLPMCATRGWDKSSLSYFGEWFGSTLLDREWALEVLVRLLTFGVKVEPEHRILEVLADLAVEYPEQAFDALERFAETLDFDWLSYRSNHVGTVVQLALATPRRHQAVAFVHLLGKRGMSWARDLLPKESG